MKVTFCFLGALFAAVAAVGAFVATHWPIIVAIALL